MKISEAKQMLETRVTGIEYSFKYRTGRLYMEHGCCCDMQGCINFFRTIDPDVASIRTFAGIKEDTSYRRSKDGVSWEASLEGDKFGPCEVPHEAA
jgi:hypothetical protein